MAVISASSPTALRRLASWLGVSTPEQLTRGVLGCTNLRAVRNAEFIHAGSAEGAHSAMVESAAAARITPPVFNSKFAPGKERMNTLWSHHYYIWGQGLAVSAMVAALPILVLLVLLGIVRKAAWVAGLWGLGAHPCWWPWRDIACPVGLTLSSAAYGAAFGLFPISWIVFWAIVLYNVTVATGKFTIIKDSLGSLTPDLRIQAVIIAFGFGGFLEGAAGFGTPVAVAAAMMVGLGFSALLCLRALPAGQYCARGVRSHRRSSHHPGGNTGLPVEKLSGAVETLCAPIALILPAYMIAVMGGAGAALEIWPALLAAGLTFGTMEYVVSNFVGVQLSDILSSTSSMAAVVLLLRFWRPRAGATLPRPNERR